MIFFVYQNEGADRRSILIFKPKFIKKSYEKDSLNFYSATFSLTLKF